MGVHGLTTYLKHNRQHLSRTVVLPPALADAAPQPVIIDGWSLIYILYRQTGLPWIYGGEYAAYGREVKRLVQAWREVGLEPVVVFDGPTPPAKFGTSCSRLDRTRKDILLTYRSGAIARLHPGPFVIPPLAYSATLTALAEEDANFRFVECFFADGEADGFAVELARLREAWIFAVDSDFVIYIGAICGESSGAGMGYVPLDEMVWVMEDTGTPSTASSIADGDDFAFQPVKSKRKRTSRSSGLIPPTNRTGQISLSMSFYPPLSLSTYLKMPPTHLPLLASFLGTDFTPPSLPANFHPSSLSPVQCVERTANALRTAAAAQEPDARRGTLTPDAGYNKALDLIMRTIDILVLRAPIASGIMISLREHIITSTLQYALPPPLLPSPWCPLHPADACSLPTALVPSAFDDYPHAQTKPLYLSAYRAGHVAPELLDPISTSTFWPSVFLEDPDVMTPSILIGRDIRQWIYAVLDESIGIFEDPDPDPLSDEEMENGLADGLEEDEDEVISVRELDSDEEPEWVKEDKKAAIRAAARKETERYHGFLPELGTEPDNSPELRSLHAALRRLRRSPASSAAPSMPQSAIPTIPASPALSPLRKPFVIEYVRRGQKISTDRVDVRRIVPGDLLPAEWTWDEVVEGKKGKEVPVCLRSEEERARVMLHALRAESLDVLNWEGRVDRGREKAHLTLAARWAILKMQERGEDWRWQKAHLRALARSLFEPTSLDADSTVPLENEAITRTAQLLHALENIAWLSQVLLLDARCCAGEALFNGRAFHQTMSLESEGLLSEEAEEWANTVIQGLQGDVWGTPRGKKGKKERRAAREKVVASSIGPVPKVRKSGGGMFAALEGLSD